MKLVFYIHSMSCGGAERVTARLASHWADRGWQVYVVTNTRTGSDFYRLHPDVTRIGLGLARPSPNVVAGLVANGRRALALRGELARIRPDRVIAMMSTANILLALASRGLGLKVLGSERNYPPRMKMSGLWKRLRDIAYPLLDALVVLTNETAQWFEAHTRVYPGRIHVIPNAVSIPIARTEPCISAQEIKCELGCSRLMLGVGRLAPQKGLDRLLSAFARLAPHHPEWGLVILGEGALRGALEAQIERLELSARVRLPGAVGNVGEWYEACDLYVLSSRFEGFPNTLLEAMGYGLPVIAVDCDTGPRDIVRHGHDGLLVSQDAEADLVEAIDRLMNDEGYRMSLAERAVDVRERFSLERIAGLWEALLFDL